MHSLALSLATILAFTAPAVASPLVTRDAAADAATAAALKAWNVTSVDSFTPSGRPGSYPWATITANVIDPNQLKLGKASDGTQVTAPANSQGMNCQAKYFTGGSTLESPLGRTWPCDAVDDGYWTMTVLVGTTGSFSTEDFKLMFTHVADELYQGTEFKATYQATGAFKLGGNLSGTCGGSGVCDWSLKAPVAITPKKVS